MRGIISQSENISWKNIHISPKSVEGWIFWLFPSPIIVVLSVGCQFWFKSHNVWDSNFAISFQIGNWVVWFPNPLAAGSQMGTLSRNWAAVWKYTLNPSWGVPNTPIVFTGKVFVRPSSVQNLMAYIRMTGTASCFKGSLTSTACVRDVRAVSVDADSIGYAHICAHAIYAHWISQSA